MRRLDSDTKKIIELYKYDKEKEIRDLMIKRREEIRDEVYDYVKEQKSKILFFDSAISNINIRYKGKIEIKYYFEVNDYQSDFNSLYDEDSILRGLSDSLAEIINERKNIMLTLQFAESESKEFKEALQKLGRSD